MDSKLLEQYMEFIIGLLPQENKSEKELSENFLTLSILYRTKTILWDHCSDTEICGAGTTNQGLFSAINKRCRVEDVPGGQMP